MLNRKKQSGFVLLVTVIIIAAITGIILAYSQSVRIFHNYSSTTIADSNLRNAARSGLQIALAHLNSSKEIAGITKLNFNIDDINCEITIECENGKININNLVNSSGEYNRSYCEILLRLIDLYNDNPENQKINRSLAPAIIDAIDADNSITELPFIAGNNRGAEKDYYRNNDLPLSINKPFENIADLAFVRDTSSRLLANTATDSDRSFINCLAATQHKTIDINSAPAEILAALSDDLTLEKAREIQTALSNNGFSSLEDFFSIAGISSDITALETILEIKPTNKSYAIYIQAKNNYKTINLTAYAKKDDNKIYNVKEMYCN